jgi:hypothetical protein
VARAGDRPATVGTGPQHKSGWLSCWALEDPAGSRTTGCLDLAHFHDRLRISRAAGGGHLMN